MFSSVVTCTGYPDSYSVLLLQYIFVGMWKEQPTSLNVVYVLLDPTVHMTMAQSPASHVLWVITVLKDQHTLLNAKLVSTCDIE